MSKRILIVEDQEDNRTILRDVLSTVGYGPIEALNGKDGVRLAKSERPDLILMDIQLPEMDGYEVIVLTVLFPSATHAERRVVLLGANNRRQPKSSVSGWTAALKTFPHL